VLVALLRSISGTFSGSGFGFGLAPREKMVSISDTDSSIALAKQTRKQNDRLIAKQWSMI
jgi:hypothetical protein